MKRAFVLLGVALAACEPGYQTGGAAFAHADGFDASGRPFSLLRFTPSDRARSVAGTAVRRHPSGDIVLAGVFDGTADVGVGPARLEGAATAFVGRYSPSGKPRWVKWMRSASYDGPRVAVDPAGDVVVLATTTSAPRPFGEPEAPCTARAGCPFVPSIFVLSADGETRTARVLPSRDVRERMNAELVETDASNGVTVAGRFGVGNDLFVARYAAGGERRFFTRVRAPGGATAAGIALAPDGDVVLLGDAHDELRAVEATAQSRGAFAMRLDREGAPRWLRPLGSGDATSLAVAVDRAGDPVVVLRQRAATGERALVEKLAGATGEPTWSQPIEKRDGAVRRASIDLAGGAAPIVAFQVQAGAQNAAVVVALGADGAMTWARQLRNFDANGAWAVEAQSVASLGPNEAVVTGWFAGRADLAAGVADSPWGTERKSCRIDDDDDACRQTWAARTMFVARVSPP